MLLALDTTLGLSLALSLPSGSVQQGHSTESKASSDLHPMVQQLFTQAGATPAQLTTIAVTVGPGSFTGIRIGLAFAQAIQLVHPHIHITGLCTLGTLALQHSALHHTTVPFTVALDAAGGMAYTQTFDEHAGPLTDPHVDPTTSLAESAYPLYHQASLLLPTTSPTLSLSTFTHLEPEVLLMAHATAHLHRPATPTYLKPLTYQPQA